MMLLSSLCLFQLQKQSVNSHGHSKLQELLDTLRIPGIGLYKDSSFRELTCTEMSAEAKQADCHHAGECDGRKALQKPGHATIVWDDGKIGSHLDRCAEGKL